MFFNRAANTTPEILPNTLFQVKNLERFSSFILKIARASTELNLSKFKIDHDMVASGSNVPAHELMPEDLIPLNKGEISLTLDDVLKFEGANSEGKLTFSFAYGNDLTGITITVDYNYTSSFAPLGIELYTSVEQKFLNDSRRVLRR